MQRCKTYVCTYALRGISEISAHLETSWMSLLEGGTCLVPPSRKTKERSTSAGPQWAFVIILWSIMYWTRTVHLSLPFDELLWGLRRIRDVVSKCSQPWKLRWLQIVSLYQVVTNKDCCGVFTVMLPALPQTFVVICLRGSRYKRMLMLLWDSLFMAALPASHNELWQPVFSITLNTQTQNSRKKKKNTFLTEVGI